MLHQRHQPHATVIVWDSFNDKVLFASENTASLLGTDEIVGASLAKGLGRKAERLLKGGLNPYSDGSLGQFSNPLTFNDKEFDVSLEISCSLVAVAFEQRPTNTQISLQLDDLDHLMRAVRQSENCERGIFEFLNRFSVFAGYDSVALAIRKNEHWCVTHQNQSTALPGLPTTLDTDLFSKRSQDAIRLIFDIDAQPVVLPGVSWVPTAVAPPDAGETALMKLCRARSMIACPVPVQSTVADAAWIIGLHKTARGLNIASRKLLQIATQQLGSFLDFHHAHLRQQKRAQGRKLLRFFASDDRKRRGQWSLDDTAMEELCKLISADGLSCRINNKWHHYGDISFNERALELEGSVPETGTALATSAPETDAPTIVKLCSKPPRAILFATAPELKLFAVRNFDGGVDDVEWSFDQIHLFEQAHHVVSSVATQWKTERTSQRQKLLIHELNHRVRNILAIVRALIVQSGSSSGNVEDYATALAGRIAAISKTHDLIVGAFKGSASIRQIIENEADAFALKGDQIIIRGDDAALPSDQAVAFALVVHELMTNASKYGALSSPNGTVRIDLTGSEAGLAITWVESGGPMPKQGRTTGFGTKLISSIVPVQLNGHLAVDFAPGGLQISLTIQLPEIDESTSERQGSAPMPLEKYRPSDSHPSNDGISEKPRRCLIVEDEVLVAMDTQRVIEDETGIECVIASNEKDARQALKDNFIVFVVLDVNLGNGGTSAKLAFELMQSAVPFAFLSGYGAGADLPRAFNGVPRLNKPLDPRMLKTHLEQFALDQSHPLMPEIKDFSALGDD